MVIQTIIPVILHLTIDGEEIETTPEHPFYANGAWVAAEDLEIGDSIQQADGTSGTLEKIESETRLQAMYNLTVATAHMYFRHPSIQNSIPVK